jgi:probable HAF family extracellular repeat protein
MRIGHARLIVIAAALLFPSTAAAQYTVTDHGSLGGGFSFAHDVNSRGQVVGRASLVSGHQHAFLWEDGVMRDLGTLPGGSFSEAFAINDLRQVVGFSTHDEATCTESTGCWHAFLWENGTMTDLGALDGDVLSYAYSINNQGQIAGISNRGSSTDPWHAVVWDHGTITDLGPVPGARNTFAFGVNDKGQVAGSWEGPSGRKPLLWSQGSTIALSTLPGSTYTEAYKINNRGLVVGVSQTDRPPAVLWTQGKIRDLGMLPDAAWSFGRDVNNLGQVVGESLIPSSGHRAFVWEDGSMVDLGTLPGGTDSYARGVNDSGLIVGASHNGLRVRAVLWRKD